VDVSIYYKKEYAGLYGGGVKESKAKQTQFLLVPRPLWELTSEFEKTKPILGKGKRKKAKGKMRVNPEFLRKGDLKKQSQC
jgi:hypothetical protein